MELNLIPPFIPRETGLILNDTLKIHCNKPSVEDHSLFDEELGLRIPFTLNGTFSAFASRSLNEQEIASAEDYQTVFLTPSSNSWDPYNKSYKLNEDSHLDSSGRTVPPTEGTHHELVWAEDVSATDASGGDNDAGIKSADKPRPKSVS